ncbi:MAG: phenylacetate--CoA ligase [Deltaproteobacteria bacterium]|nr:phenylacetate--CoA ligase [Deltaproteobacteria bacterium]
MDVWDAARECMTRDELEQLQLERLQATLNRVYRNVNFYKKSFDEIGFVPEALDHLSSLAGLPFTTRGDLAAAYPYEMFAVPLREVVRVHASSGTPEAPSVVGYTSNDLKHWSDLVARLLTAAGVTKEDVIQVAFSYGLPTGAFGLHYGAERIGASVIPSSVGNTQRLDDMKIDAKTLTLKRGLFGGEPWKREVRGIIEEKLFVDAYDNYGLSEVMGPGIAAECRNKDGMHVYEDHFIPEIVDPDTGQVLSEGEVGELVLTTITKEAFPVIRFRTGDLTSLNDERCSCGRTFCRIAPISGRCDDIVIIKGINVYPKTIGAILSTVTGTEPVYQLAVGQTNHQDYLEIRIEVSEGFFFDKMEKQRTLVERLQKKIRDIVGLTGHIVLVEKGSISRGAETSPMVVDMRKQTKP